MSTAFRLRTLVACLLVLMPPVLEGQLIGDARSGVRQSEYPAIEQPPPDTTARPGKMCNVIRYSNLPVGGLYGFAMGYWVMFFEPSPALAAGIFAVNITAGALELWQAPLERPIRGCPPLVTASGKPPTMLGCRAAQWTAAEFGGFLGGLAAAPLALMTGPSGPEGATVILAGVALGAGINIARKSRRPICTSARLQQGA